MTVRSAAAAIALLAVTPAAAKEIAPFHADLVVLWGHGAGSDVFRDELARNMAERLGTTCFSGVHVAERPDADSDAELLYTIVLSDVVDETRFDDSIAGTLQPGGEPTHELRRVAHFEVAAEGTLTARESGAIIHRKHIVARAERRPVYVGEDPQSFARSEASFDVVDSLARALGCGSAKLSKKIREALPH